MSVNPKLFWVFFGSMFLPTAVGISVAGLRLSVYRITLLMFIVTAGVAALRLCSPRLSNPAFLMLMYAIWATLAVVVNHGFGEVEAAGIYFIETLGPFFIVILFCNSVDRLVKICSVYTLVIFCTILFTLPENLTRINWLKELLDPIFPSPPIGTEKRMGLYRAAGSFDHPILQGVVASTAVGLAWYIRGLKGAGLAALAGATSVSSGAIVAISSQLALIGWDKFFKGIKRRWLLLASVVVLGYLAISLISNRSAIQAILGNITMSPHTAYYRTLIWEFGMQNVYANPFFGIGFHEWQRADWMTGSIDAFWLVSMVRYGFIAFFFYAGATLLVMKTLFGLKLEDAKLMAIRRGWLVGMFGLIIASCTVHLWNNAYVFFNFYLGLGAAMCVIFRREQRISSMKETNVEHMPTVQKEQ